MPLHRDICTGCGTCSECIELTDPAKHRGSRSHVDPIFYDAAFRPFTPAEKSMVEEKELPHLLRSKGAL